MGCVFRLFSVLCIKSGQALGHQPLVICKALSTPVRDEESAATGSPLAAIIQDHKDPSGSRVWRGLDLEPHNVTTRSCQRVNLHHPAQSSAHCCYFCCSHECGEMSRDEVTSHHPAAQIVTDCSAQRHSNIWAGPHSLILSAGNWDSSVGWRWINRIKHTIESHCVWLLK